MQTSDTASGAPALPRQRDLLEVAALLALAALGVGVSHALGDDVGPGAALAFVAILAELALVLWLHRRRGEGWGALGLARPRSWGRTVGLALLATPLVMVAAGLVQVGVVAALADGAAPDHSRFDALRGDLPRLLLGLVSVWVTAAFAEEVIYRGFLTGRLARVLGGSGGAWWAALLASSVVFGGLHLYQGWVGMLMTGIVGFLLGALYLLTRRNLWVAILVHGLVDTISLGLIYAGVAS